MKKAAEHATNLLEVVAELDDGRALKHPLLVDDELSVLEGVDVALDQEKIRAALDGQEAGTGDVDTVGVLEVLDTRSGSGLELDDSLTIVVCLRVDDDIELHLLVGHDVLQRCTMVMSMPISTALSGSQYL